jgi:plastocyanin
MSRRLLILAASLGLLLTAAIATAPFVLAGGGCHVKEAARAAGNAAPAGPAAADAAVVVNIDTCDFAPRVTRIPVGATVAFVNRDATPHQVTGYHSTWSSAILEQGQSYSWHFNEAGVHPYSCPLHPGMVGAVVVGGTLAAAGADTPGTLASTEQAPEEPAASGSSGIEPLAAVAVGALSGLIVVAIGGALARRRPIEERLAA